MKKNFLVYLVGCITLLSINVSAAFGNAPIITIDEKGFSPSELHINAGEEVQFINSGLQDHWPASDIHPTHGIYPEFDPKKSLKPQATWSFVFNKAGEWTMHDHLNPHLTGRIIVKGKTSTNVKPKVELSWIDGLKIHIMKWIPIYRESYLKKIKLIDLAYKNDMKGMSFLVNLLDQKTLAGKIEAEAKQKKTDCHKAAHIFGRVYYEQLGLDFFKNISLDCSSGFLHGAMEGYLSQNELDTFMGKAEELCYSYKQQFTIFSCMHGIGHGVFAAVNFNLPLAISNCNKLSNSTNRQSCFGGVFMENVTSASGISILSPHASQWLNSDPHFPCRQYDFSSDEQVQCYVMQASWTVRLFNNDYEKMTAVCKELLGRTRRACFIGIGRQADSAKNPKIVVDKCKYTPETSEDYKNCLYGGLMDFIDFWGDQFTNQPQMFCNQLDEDKTKTYCYEQFAGRLRSIFGNNVNKMKEICSYSDPHFVKKCEEKANL